MEYLFDVPLTEEENEKFVDLEFDIRDEDGGRDCYHRLLRFEKAWIEDFFTPDEIGLFEDEFDYVMSTATVVWKAEFFRTCLRVIANHPHIKDDDAKLINSILQKIDELYFYNLNIIH